MKSELRNLFFIFYFITDKLKRRLSDKTWWLFQGKWNYNFAEMGNVIKHWTLNQRAC